MKIHDKIVTIEVRLSTQFNSSLALADIPNLGRPSRPCPGGTKWQNQHSNSLLEKTSTSQCFECVCVHARDVHTRVLSSVV